MLRTMIKPMADAMGYILSPLAGLIRYPLRGSLRAVAPSRSPCSNRPRAYNARELTGSLVAARSGNA